MLEYRKAILYTKKDYQDYINKTLKDLKDKEMGKRSIMSLLSQALSKTDKVRIETYFDVHGSITFSDGGKNSKYPIESDLWWFGFDCAHYGDKADLELACKVFPEMRKQIKSRMEIERQFGGGYGIIRDCDYVVSECMRLAEQLKEFE